LNSETFSLTRLIFIYEFRGLFASLLLFSKVAHSKKSISMTASIEITIHLLIDGSEALPGVL
jgi:hypothetical protein